MMTTDRTIKVNMKSEKPIICCPQRRWFRWLIYIQFLVVVVHPDLRDEVWGIIPIVLYYIIRMPDFCVFDDGIEINIWGYERFIEWDKIRKVRMTSKQLIISEGFVLLPIYIFYWRKNFKETQDILESKLGEKAKRYSFPLPF
jgi:hypothetical protein